MSKELKERPRRMYYKRESINRERESVKKETSSNSEVQ